MAIEGIGALTEADETLHHQIADTFATVRESDRGWTEKIWGSVARKDGGMVIDFGLGKYINRNVCDAFGGVSRGDEQWTVRASRELGSNLEEARVGPLRYEVVEPLQRVRFVLEANATQPIAYDVLFAGELPPFFEKRNLLRAGNRISHDVVRYHQAGRVSGWVEIAGRREILNDDWFAFRDHSWGMRGDGVGALPTDTQPGKSGRAKRRRLLWGPWLLTRPDGSKYEVMTYLIASGQWEYFSGCINEADGSQQEIRRITPNFRFDTKNRRFLGGSCELLMDGGETRRIEVAAQGASGFYLRTGEYGGWKGGRHGVWRGKYHEHGEYIADIVPELPGIGQLRDTPVLVREGDAVGYGIQESIYSGLFPELGLAEDSDFPSNLI